MKNYCPTCGKELSETAKFCEECGQQVDEGKTRPKATKRRPATKAATKVIPLVIFLVVLVIVGYFLYNYIEFDSVLPPMGGLSGTWEGSGTFTNNCENPACRYVGTMNPPSVILQLEQDGNYVFGTVTINIPQSRVQALLDQPCTGFDNSVSDIYNGRLSGNRLTFTDLGGNTWTLNFLSSTCQGSVSSDALGCTGLQGTISLSKK